jgi:RimJ/RimL family protein N-acetyltransferase
LGSDGGVVFFPAMEIRAIRLPDIDRLIDIDATIESTHYLHVEQAGEGLEVSLKLSERPLREPRNDRNLATDELNFSMKQVVSGIEDGVALLAEHDGLNVATMLAVVDPTYSVMRLIDVRVDFEHRRQGLASGMMYQLIAESRNRELRAIAAETRTDNHPAAKLLEKCAFELSGLDTRRHTNYDLVKETATLIWYALLD